MVSLDEATVEKIIGAVKVRLGVSLSKDDPLFALVVMNDEIVRETVATAILVADQTMRGATNAMDRASAQIRVATDGHKKVIAEFTQMQIDRLNAECPARLNSIAEPDSQVAIEQFSQAMAAMLQRERAAREAQTPRAHPQDLRGHLLAGCLGAAVGAACAIGAALSFASADWLHNPEAHAPRQVAEGTAGRTRPLASTERNP